jgi:hypothetical protein
MPTSVFLQASRDHPPLLDMVSAFHSQQTLKMTVYEEVQQPHRMKMTFRSRMGVRMMKVGRPEK